MKFQKSTCLILAMLVLFSNAGLAFSLHFCEGKVAAVSSVFHSGPVCEMEKQPIKKTCCAKKKAEKHRKCCSDKKVSLTSKSDNGIFKNVAFQFEATFPKHEPLNPTQEKATVLRGPEKTIRYYCDAHSPPLYLLYSHCILYA
ncbi:hypothetical protein HYN48_01225 [Flavobacterium magnum]|uniref:Uncharacterized protein n=1 Tax=Flavobacterium magnum TaxID=2162713 RepID=A0A2S0RB58_9FLAO|nr:hypothetical protein [Flavobacterium magnum]AWA28819.1 hypothetical protein HYN48_01225 [Flavobacterium magnum]